jgi:hypothetical protein
VSSFSGTKCEEGKVCKDGDRQSASFGDPVGITIDQKTGNLFICDYKAHLIRMITPQGVNN